LLLLGYSNFLIDRNRRISSQMHRRR